MVHDIEHPRIGPMKTIGLPIKSSGDLGQIRLPAPWLGQHSQEIVASAGLRRAGYPNAVPARRDRRPLSRVDLMPVNFV